MIMHRFTFILFHLRILDFELPLFDGWPTPPDPVPIFDCSYTVSPRIALTWPLSSITLNNEAVSMSDGLGTYLSERWRFSICSCFRLRS